MTCKTGSVALLLGALGVAAGAAANENPSGLAENRGLSPIIQGLLDYAQTFIETGEEIMFTIDVPYVPVQDTPIVLAQAATPGVAPQPDYLLKECSEFSSGGGG